MKNIKTYNVPNDKRLLNGAAYSLDQVVNFKASAYDDDSWFLQPNAKDSLGEINYSIDLRTLGSTPKTIFFDDLKSMGGKGQFGLEIEIKLTTSKESTTFTKIMSKYNPKIIKDIASLKETRYKLKDFPPVVVNLDTMARHGLAEKNSRVCGNWSKAKGNKLELHMFEYELFEKVDGKTRLHRIVEKIHGEDSELAKSVADKDITAFKGTCNCRKDGR